MIRSAVRQPVTVAVGVLLVLLAGVVAIQRIPIQLTPNVEDTIVSVSTFWEGASPYEIEQEIVDEQEDKLLGLANLRSVTSSSQQSTGSIRLEFNVGTPKAEALREVSDKLREVPEYPAGADEPVIEASDPENRDFIAWVVLQTTDPDLDIRDLQDFAEDRLVPVLERIPGMAEVNALGGREREVQVRFDPIAVAQRGIPIDALVGAIQRTNTNRSAGDVPEAKSDVRLRLVSQYQSVADVEATVVANTEAGPVRVSDVAEVFETFKEPRTFVRSRGRPVIAVNFQREVGSNVMEVMDDLKAALADLNKPGGILDREAERLGLDGELRLQQVYDQTIYIDDALALVRNNIWIGGALAITVLLLFLRSLRGAGIIALAIPISAIGAVVVMVALGRTVNVISLAGMAFAIGMVVDNAIVVLENVYRHLELGKRPFDAAVDGTREVFGAILASTLTTVCVFIPILLIEEEAGQLFRDIALAIVAAVSLSLLVSVTVIPVCAARLLKHGALATDDGEGTSRRKPSRLSPATWVGGLIYRLSGSILARLAIVALFTGASIYGTVKLLPPADYLPTGNRNLVFGLLIPPPGYNLEQRSALGARIEESIRPYWEAGLLRDDPEAYDKAAADLPAVPTFDFATMQPGEPLVPPPLENYFLVAFEDILFHGAISSEPERVPQLSPLFAHATRGEVAPGVFAFAFQVPLFQLGGASGSAVKINFVGDDLREVSDAALAVFMELMGRFGPASTQPDPANFNVPGPELRVVPDLVRLAEAGLTPAALGTAVQALGDGAIIGDYEIGGQTIDLKLVAADSPPLAALGDTPIATPMGGTLPVSALADLRRVNAASQINRVSRQRSVTLQFTPQNIPLEEAVDAIAGILESKRAEGVIPPTVQTSFTGSASKLEAVRRAMLGDGTLAGAISSSLVLALVVVYLLMCVLFQSFSRPAVIMFSVPLATLGGFAALYGVHVWSLIDPLLPIQNLDVLTMLGFVILVGVVVNNAILIVHQALNLMRGSADVAGAEGQRMGAREAIAESTRTRVRPIFMSTLTSVGGMAPLVFMPGAGSELYRGLGSVVVGGLLVSTVFTLFLVPLLFSLLCDLQEKLGVLKETQGEDAREDSPGASKRGSLAAHTSLVLFALSLAFVAGACRTRPSVPPSEQAARELEAAKRTQTLRTLGEPVPARAPGREASRVDAVLGGRLDELERLAGPEAWRAADPRIASDLLGNPQAVVGVDLASVVASAARNNLGLSRARLAPRIADAEAEVLDAGFDPIFYSNAEHERVDRPVPVTSVLQGGMFIPVSAGEQRARRSRLEAGLRRRLDAGGTLDAGTFIERADNKTAGIQLDPDPAWRSGVSLSVDQPLLRGFGEDVARGDVTLKQSEAEREQELLEARWHELAASTRIAYWDLFEAWERLRILERLAEEGEEVERVLFERQTFDVGPAQYSDALATVESRRAELVRARLVLRQASDRLKGIVQSPDYPPGSEVLLEATERPRDEPESFALRADVARALDQRPEVRAALLAIEDGDLRERIARNLEKPDLAFVGEVSLAGEDDEPGDSYDELDDFLNYLVGLRFELPVGNRAARAERRRARLAEREAILAYEETVLDVVLDVKAALRDVETGYALMGATRSLRLAQTENLRALLAEEEVRSEQTPEFLALKFQRQERLAQAQLDEMAALCDYNRALAVYDRAVGLPPPLVP